MGTKNTELEERPDEDRTVVYLGNRNAIEVVVDEEDLDTANDEKRAPNTLRRALPKGKRCTTVVLPPDLKLMDAAYDITHSSRGVWQAHSDADAPAWVASTDPALARLLADHWGCELREPDPDHGSDTAAASDEPAEEV